ncbi:MAG: PLP-dependent aminotransferase family protein, partial [Chloroflexota bacterium]
LGQYRPAPGVIDLAWGHPDPALLDASLLAPALAAALARHGPDALGYGAHLGPPPFRAWLRGHLATLDARAPADDELLVLPGASTGIELAFGMLAAPGDAVLVPAPTYHLALRIAADHPVRIVPVPTDAAGILPDAAAYAIRRIGATGGRARFLYLVPVCANPTGVTLPRERRAALAALAAETGVTILEDDVYRELTLDGPPPPSIWALAEPGSVLRLGSVSKTLAPAVRVGWMTGDGATIARLAGSGLLDSGGGLQPLLALAVAELGTSGAYAANLARIRAGLTERREALVAALRAAVPGATFHHPDGGYFLWLRLPAGVDPVAALPVAQRHGVTWIPGARFAGGTDAGDGAVRLAFSRNGPAELAEAAARIGRAVAEVAAG